MDIEKDFAFAPHPEISTPRPLLTSINPTDPLGALKDLPGTWTGNGFNLIWLPHHPASGAFNDRLLKLSLFSETLEIESMPGSIPNRGYLQGDITMHGVTYLQQAIDINTNEGLHVEPGIWATAPMTSAPPEPSTIIRIASIPHGTAVLAQGFASQFSGPPRIPCIDTIPFIIGARKMKIPFPEANLSIPTANRSPPGEMAGVTQAMVDDPNSVLISDLAEITVAETIELHVSSDHAITGGGAVNSAFLDGTRAGGPNAQTALVTARFWIETRVGQTSPDYLQYSQTVLLNFRGLSWPHVTVATLQKA